MLHLSPDLAIPDGAVTQTFGILAVRGAGKSNTAAVMAEEMFAAKLPFVVIDPVGAWWGLRSSFDGKGPGLAIPIFGGQHGDVPLNRESGELLADLIVEKRLSCVVDISNFDSEASKKHFLLIFAKRLYAKNRHPLHLFLEEADDYIPQKPMRDETHLLRAWENIVRRGRARGLGITLITQRSACINKNVLTQIETLFAMRTTSPQDRAAIAEWVKWNSQGTELLASLSGLSAGEAWCWSPSWLSLTKRVQIRRRSTFDSGATPVEMPNGMTFNKATEQWEQKGQAPPATLADVDLPALSKAWETTIEKAREEDPKALREKVRDLETRLKASGNTAPLERVAELEGKLRSAVGQLEDWKRAAATAMQQLLKIADEWDAARNALLKLASDLEASEPQSRVKTEFRDLRGLPSSSEAYAYARDVTAGPIVTARGIDPASAGAYVNEDDAPSEKAIRVAKAGPFSTGEGRILRALAQHGTLSKSKLAILSLYTPSGGGFNNLLSSLRTRAFIEGSAELSLTKEGAKALGPYDPLPTDGYYLFKWWSERQGKAAKTIMDVLLKAGGSQTKSTLARAAGYEVTGGGFNNALSRLRTLELIEGRHVIDLHPSLRDGR